jgi:hypothetical protein
MVQSTPGGAISMEEDLVSLDADGFTLNETVDPGATGALVGALCLNLRNVAVGTLTKPTGSAPAVGTVSGLPFTPILVILVSDQDINRSNVAQVTGGSRFGFSAFTKDAAEASVAGQANGPSPWNYFFLDKSGKAAVKIDNATPAIDAECTGALTGDGFSLTWNANDAVATEYGYVALGA